MVKPDNKIEPIVLLLAVLLIIFSAILIFCEKVFPMDGQIFQVFSGILGNVGGAMLMRIKPRGTDPGADPPPSKTTTTIDKEAGTLTQETQVGAPAEAKKPDA